MDIRETGSVALIRSARKGQPAMPAARAFHTLDVFTDTPYTGNPLAVALDADGLNDAQMQTIAREFNLTETIFVLKPQDPAHAARARVFSPTAGIPEDPATGSASAILAGQLLRSGNLSEGETNLRLTQGVDMGRPSRIGVTNNVKGNAIANVRISGSAVRISDGTLRPPEAGGGA